MKKKVLPRVFFDIEIEGNPVGRVVFQLFSDVCPKTTENFRCLCTGERGLGDTTSKPLHYKGVVFHRVVRDFMIQAGDFSEGNGRGGESIYGGYFADESFEKKHDEPFLLSMANRGKNTNGSQFFVTTQPTPHLDGVHVVFGRVVTGKSIIKKIESQPTDANSRPNNECKIVHCGELVLAKTKKVKAKKMKDSVKDSDDDSSDSSKDDSSDSEEEIKKKKKEKKKKHKKEKKKKKAKSKDSSDEDVKEDPDSARTVSSIKADEVPPVPEQKFLMRGEQTKKDEEKTQDSVTPSSARSQGRQWRTRSGRKVKGRGVMRYRTPSRSRSRSPYRSSRRSSYRSRRDSETPPHWREAQRGQRPLKEVTGRSLGSPDSGKWRQTSRSPSDVNTERRNHRVTSPWASDDDSKTRKRRDSLSEGEWSNPDDHLNDSKEYEEGELREEKKPRKNGAQSKELDLTIEGPALPPGYNDKSKRKRRRSTKSNSSRRRKKSKKSKESYNRKSKTLQQPEKDETESVEAHETTNSVVEQPEPEANQNSPKYSAERGVVKSKWDSTDEDDSANNVTNTELPEPPDHIKIQTASPKQPVTGVLGADKLLKGKRRELKRENKKKLKNIRTRHESDSDVNDRAWHEATSSRVSKKRRISENSSVKSSPSVTRKSGRIEKPSSSKKINKSSRQSSARLFEQARNVLLKAEAELAAIGYHKASSSLSGKLRHRSRSRRYSSSRSRSRSRSGERYRRQDYSRDRRRSYTRSNSRSRHSRRRNSSSRTSSHSRSRSPKRRGRLHRASSKSSGRRSSTSRSSSRSSRSASHSSSRSSSTSRSSRSNTSSSSRKKTKFSPNKNGSNTKISTVNVNKVKVQKNTEDKNLKEKTAGKVQNNSSSAEYDPYSEKSRLKNKMNKSKKEDKPKAVMTAASVRKAEKVKKQKKLKAEQLLWQPPLEFGEEEEDNVEEKSPIKNSMKPNKAMKNTKHNGKKSIEMKAENQNDIQFDSIQETLDNGFQEDEIDKMLSSGIDKTISTNGKASVNVFEKRAKSLLEFKKRQKGESINIKTEPEEIENNLSSSDVHGQMENKVTVGFGKMPKFTPKPKVIKMEPSTEVKIEKSEEQHFDADLDSIWPEDNITKLNDKSNSVETKILDNLKKENTDDQINNRNNNAQMHQDLQTKKEVKNLPSFRAQQYDLAREDTESSESEEDWTPANLQSTKKTIKINIKLPAQPPLTEDKNNNEKLKNESIDDNQQENNIKKKQRKHKKKKREKKKEEISLTSFEMIARSLRKHREKENEPKTDNNKPNNDDITQPQMTDNTKSQEPESISADVTNEETTTTSDVPEPENDFQKNSAMSPNQAVFPTTSQQARMSFPTPSYPYQMSMGMRPPRGYPFPPFSYNNTPAMHPMNMRYPMSHPPLPMPVNMPPLPDADSPPPLPEENFPSQPPEPKGKCCKLSDDAVTDFFKKKNITSERLSTLLAGEDRKDERLPSPAPSLEERKSKNRQRASYRGRHRSSSSSSYSSNSSRSSSRSRDRSRRSRSKHSGSRRSRSSSYDSYYSSSDRSRSSHKCRHRSRSRSSSYDSYSSRSRSRSRSHGRRSSARRRSRDYSTDSEYSSRSRSRSRSYSRSRSTSRRRS
ncbi:uncharacterized protein LOC120341883 [Styela clava]